MKMYLISDNVDTYTGMRLAGVEGVVVHERKELKEALELSLIHILSTLSSRKEVYYFGYYHHFFDFDCGKCSWLLHMQMVRSES